MARVLKRPRDCLVIVPVLTLPGQDSCLLAALGCLAYMQVIAKAVARRSTVLLDICGVLEEGPTLLNFAQSSSASKLR
eukprot:2914057-Pleurochrysis_carterae.AAC.8